MESSSPDALPRIGILKGEDLVYFIYFGLIFIILKRIQWRILIRRRPETVIGRYFPSEDFPVGQIMTTKELSPHPKLHKITFCKCASEAKILTFELAVHGIR